MKKKTGLTFIEVLIASMIVGIVLPSMFVGLNFASKYARHNAHKTMALYFAQEKMEELDGEDFNTLDTYESLTDTVDIYSEEYIIEAERSVTILEEKPDGRDEIPAEDYYRRITVTVSWDWQGNNYSEEVTKWRSNY